MKKILILLIVCGASSPLFAQSGKGKAPATNKAKEAKTAVTATPAEQKAVKANDVIAAPAIAVTAAATDDAKLSAASLPEATKKQEAAKVQATKVTPTVKKDN